MENEKTTRDSFVVYRSMLESAMMYDGIDQTELLAAIFKYGLDGVEPVFTHKYVMATWISMKPNIDNACKKRDAKVAAGSKGGTISKKPSTIQSKINLDTPKEASNEVKLKSEVIVPKEVKEVITNQINIEEEIAEREAEQEVDTTPSFSTKNFLKAKLINYVKERELLEANEEQLLKYIQDEKITSLVEINETIDNMFNKGK